MSTEIVKAGGALAIRPDQTEWTPAQAAVLQQSGISEDVTAAELSGFLHLCQRTQLDPFSRQIYLIGRKDKRAGRTVFTPQTGIDGYRVVAHRVVAESGASFGYEDTVWCDGSGRWRDVWLSDAPPAAAKVTVLRNGQSFSAVALYREYVQTGWENKPIGLWGKMPASQLAKCAEALALRKAFPHDLAGVYTAEEMAQADNPTPATGQRQAPVRQLRQVQPGEPDPWQTSQAPAPEAADPAQEIAGLAAKATDRTRWRQLWSVAATGRLLDTPVTAPDGDATESLRAYLTRRGQELPDAVTADADPGGDDIPDIEVVPDEPVTPFDERTAAITALKAAAAAAGMTQAELDEGFIGATGLPVEEAKLSDIQGWTRTLSQSAGAA